MAVYDLQRRGALALANETRSATAKLKREIAGLPAREAFALAADAVQRFEDRTGALRLHDLLVAIPGLGPKTADRLIDSAGVAAGCRVRDLTPGQRDSLTRVLSVSFLNGRTAA